MGKPYRDSDRASDVYGVILQWKIDHPGYGPTPTQIAGELIPKISRARVYEILEREHGRRWLWDFATGYIYLRGETYGPPSDPFSGDFPALPTAKRG